MKRCLVLLPFMSNLCLAQHWEAEIMAGAAGYKGDLTQHVFSLKGTGPAAAFNLKYNYNELFILRGGIAWGQISADDKDNHRADLRNRNLNFHTTILEANLCLEMNLLEPDFFSAYPYVFLGLGVFHFNPYTYDDDGHKAFLQPLGTEGQGLAAYPDRKPYSRTQLCLPFGGGFKIYLNKHYDLVYELAGRALFTDYLDDVSTTYVNKQLLMVNSRPKAAELAYRQTNAPFPAEGDIRGDPKVKDWYFMTGLKLLIRLSQD
jgi:hypothetical protein